MRLKSIMIIAIMCITISFDGYHNVSASDQTSETTSSDLTRHMLGSVITQGLESNPGMATGALGGLFPQKLSQGNALSTAIKITGAEQEGTRTTSSSKGGGGGVMAGTSSPLNSQHGSIGGGTNWGSSQGSTIIGEMPSSGHSHQELFEDFEQDSPEPAAVPEPTTMLLMGTGLLGLLGFWRKKLQK